MTRTDERLRRQPGIHQEGGSRRSALGLFTLLTVIGLISWWGWSGRQAEPLVGVGESVSIPGGFMMVAEVRPEIMVHSMAPGMTMPDEVPDGYRRFSIDLLFQGGRGGMTVYPGELYVAGTALDPIPPHRVAGTVSPLAEGATLALTVLFQAPIEAADLWLGYQGGDAVVVLEGDLGAGHDHGDHDHGDEELVPDVEISIKDNQFAEGTIRVAAGATVGWTNDETGIPHTVTFSEGGPASGVLQPGQSFSAHLDSAGSYGYFCEIHPSMRGVVVVEGP